MKISAKCGLFLALVVGTGPAWCSEVDPIAAKNPAILTPTEATQDLDFLMSTFAEVHPNLYFKMSQAELATRRTEIAAQLDHNISIRNFYDSINPFVRSFADKHTQLYPPSDAKSPSEKSAGPIKAWEFRFLPGNIGYVEFNEMPSNRRSEWQTFLQSTFQALQDREAGGLIIDLRKNGGGDSALAEDLLSYLTDHPYRLVRRKAWRLSPRFLHSSGFDNFLNAIAASKSYYSAAPTPEQAVFLAQNPSIEFKRITIARNPEWLKIYLQKYAPHWLDLDFSPKTASEWLYFDFPLIVPPSSYPLRFTRKTFFLVGKDTFSSAIILANAVQDFHLAPLIGEETPPCNQFGEVYGFNLPHSQLGAMVPSAQLVRANGDAHDRHGVLPNIIIPVSPTKSADVPDATLEAAKRLLGPPGLE